MTKSFRLERLLRFLFPLFVLIVLLIDNPYSDPFCGQYVFTQRFGPYLYSNLSTLYGIPIPFAMLEWLVFALAFGFLCSSSKREHDFSELNSAIGMTSFYFLFLLVFGIISVLAWNGNGQNAFWSMKGHVIIPFLIYISYCYFRTSNDLTKFAKIFCAGVFFKCLQALYVYHFEWDETLQKTNQYLIDHAYSYVISVVILILIFKLYWKTGERAGFGKIVLNLVVFAAVFITFVINDRRVEMAGFVVSLSAIVLLNFFSEPKKMSYMVLFLVLFGSAYWVAFSNNTGLLGRPVRMLHSLNDDNNLSNMYRIIENYNLIKTLELNPFFGQGLGTKMKVFMDLYRGSYSLFLIFPHNSILWLWMCCGFFGMLLFSGFIGVYSFLGIRRFLNTRNSLVKLTLAVCLANIVRFLMFCTGDQMWLHSSGGMIFGVSLGLILATRTFDKEGYVR